MKQAAASASDYHDFADDYLCHGAVAVLLGYGIGTAKAVVYRHDRHDVHRYGGQPLYHTAALLVYLSGKKRESQTK